ncbi:hypothetical protein [Streptomyces caeruleatus]|uniref:Phosphatase n=1 Tax=Streptomyces caeruleatus TaxID=661399 RepID=A0A101U1Y7_9ACTN|nr:hypothetical protein [Streptomyces caeruleatus]KUO02845.1 hypothetical protein AQJ67_20715 [Streptomyces caeruleatus]
MRCSGGTECCAVLCGGPAADTPEAWEHCDDRITDAAVRTLADPDPDPDPDPGPGPGPGPDPADDAVASFVHLGAPDETAHVLGCGETYEASIRRADARLGRPLAAVRSRPSYADEQWTFLVVTDQRRVDAGGHGGRTPEERTAWPAAAGPGIRPGTASAAARRRRGPGVRRPRPHADRHWTLDGRPLAAAPHAVLLDMDGTLVDIESLWSRGVREAVPRIGTGELFDVLGRSAPKAATRLQPLTGGDAHTLATDLKPASRRPSSARPCRSPALSNSSTC